MVCKKEMGKIRETLNQIGMSKSFKCLLVGTIAEYIGAICNLLVVNLNGGMPIEGSPKEFVAVVGTSLNKTYVELTEATKLPYLADIIPWGSSNLVSLGDIFMGMGFIVVVGSLSVYLYSFLNNLKGGKVT